MLPSPCWMPVCYASMSADVVAWRMSYAVDSGTIAIFLINPSLHALYRLPVRLPRALRPVRARGDESRSAQLSDALQAVCCAMARKFRTAPIADADAGALAVSRGARLADSLTVDAVPSPKSNLRPLRLSRYASVRVSIVGSLALSSMDAVITACACVTPESCGSPA